MNPARADGRVSSCSSAAKGGTLRRFPLRVSERGGQVVEQPSSADLERVQATIDTALEANTEAIDEWSRAFGDAGSDDADRFFEAAASLGQELSPTGFPHARLELQPLQLRRLVCEQVILLRHRAGVSPSGLHGPGSPRGAPPSNPLIARTASKGRALRALVRSSSAGDAPSSESPRLLSAGRGRLSARASDLIRESAPGGTSPCPLHATPPRKPPPPQTPAPFALVLLRLRSRDARW